MSRSSELVAIPSRGMRECADESATPLAAIVHAMRRLSSRNTAAAPELRPKLSAHPLTAVSACHVLRSAGERPWRPSMRGRRGSAGYCAAGTCFFGTPAAAGASGACAANVGMARAVTPGGGSAWRVAATAVDEQSHARRRCVCARWRCEHSSCCLSFDMAAMGDLVARQLVASGRQWL